jgi:leucyl aminopeptidase
MMPGRCKRAVVKGAVMSRLELSGRPVERVEADLLVLGAVERPGGPWAPPRTAALLERLGADLGALAGPGGFGGRLDETLLLASYGAVRAPAVLLVGTGPDAGRGAETLRRAAAVAAGHAGAAATVATTLHDVGLDEPNDAASAPAWPAALAAVAEGFGLAGYRFERYKQEAADRAPDRVVLLLADPAERRAAAAALHRAEVAVRATALARDLGNEPANRLNPATLAERAAAVAGERGLDCRVLDGQDLERERLGAILAVGRGSAVPPRLVELRWRPRRARRHVALVGKGVTFDAGGLDLKRGEQMAGMKDDMSGAAAVLATLAGAAELRLPLALTGLLPLVENLPGGGAMRPGDVVRARNGVTVEITNTDAEGRLILADGLSLAAEAAPDAIIDLATLTGSAIVGLGPGCTAVLGNRRQLVEQVLAAAEQAGELAWELPLIEDYREFLDAEVADIRNSTEHYGDAIQAALFLREFVGDTPWVHLDIAGPAQRKQARYELPAGATGCMVRTVLALIERFSPPDGR